MPKPEAGAELKLFIILVVGELTEAWGLGVWGSLSKAWLQIICRALNLEPDFGLRALPVACLTTASHLPTSLSQGLTLVVESSMNRLIRISDQCLNF